MADSIAANAGAPLLVDCSLGVGWKDIDELQQITAIVPTGTRVHVGFLDSDDLAMRLETVRAVRRSGFLPVPIIAARRLRSRGMLLEYLAVLRAEGASGSVLIVGGDPAESLGPYPDATSVIGSGLLEKHAVRRVSMAAHPAGHPAVTDQVLWQALAGKAAALEQRGLDASVVTQFGFDAALVLTWLAAARARGLTMPVRVSVPGPASVRRLVWYASRCGVTVSAIVAREYGLSLTDLRATAGPERFIRALASGYDMRIHGEVKLHFNSFSGIAATARWISEFQGR